MKKQILISNTPKQLFFGMLILLASLTGCSKKDLTTNTVTSTGGTTTIDSTGIVSGTAEGSVETAYNADDLVENTSFTNTISIAFGSSIVITNPLDGNGVTVTQSNGDVTIKSITSNAVEYVLSGATTNGSVKIYSDKKFKLTLNGVSITNTDGPAINIQSSKRAFIVVADNTTNTLADGTSYATSTEDMKGTFFSEGQIVFSGNGSLTVKGNYKHAIASDDYVRIRSGNITVSGAVTDGIHSNDAFIADGGVVNITATSDGIEAEEGYVVVNGGNLTIKSGDDGIAASYTDSDTSIHPFVTINDGTINITSSGGEGIESKSILTINKGNITTVTSDDGLNAGTAIYINGGNVYSYSTGNDAMDSNGTFTITGGRIVAIGSGAPEASIDCDARTLKITGGILIGIAGATSGPSTSVSTVPTVIMGSGSANRIIHIEASDGTEALTFLAPVSYSTLIFSSSKMKSGTAYTTYTGGSVTNATEFKGLYLAGTYTKGTAGSSFTITGLLTQLGGSISRN